MLARARPSDSLINRVPPGVPLFASSFPDSIKSNMVDIAQLVSASDCGSEGRGFESHYPPHEKDTHSGVFFYGIMGFEEGGRAKRGKKVSGGHFFSPGENPCATDGSPEDCWLWCRITKHDFHVGESMERRLRPLTGKQKGTQKAGSHKEVKSHHEKIVMAFIILSYFNKAIVSEISRYNCALLSRVYEISSSGSSKSNEMLNSLG